MDGKVEEKLRELGLYLVLEVLREKKKKKQMRFNQSPAKLDLPAFGHGGEASPPKALPNNHPTQLLPKPHAPLPSLDSEWVDGVLTWAVRLGSSPLAIEVALSNLEPIAVACIGHA